MTNLQALQDKIGYRFKDAVLLQQALTHSSRTGENNNERLEFLGDRVVNLIIAHALYEAFPNEPEGALAKRHAGLVQGRTLALVAADIGLADFVLLSDSERHSGGAANDNILSDAMEALLGALYLDGGFAPVQKLVLALWGARIHTLADMHADPKTELQEWAQGRGLPLPDYEITGKSGPDHAPVFEIELKIQGKPPVRAEGASRRAAEKEAAKIMLEKLKDKS